MVLVIYLVELGKNVQQRKLKGFVSVLFLYDTLKSYGVHKIYANMHMFYLSDHTVEREFKKCYE